MAGKRYSAGAIFLQVVPVFANVQRAIEDEAKNIDRALGDQMEKSGDKAGRRAGKAASKGMNEELKKGSGEFEREFHKNVDSINKALDGIDTNKLGNNLRREVAEIKRELRGLKNVDLTVDADFRQAEAKIAETEGRLRALRDNAKIVFRADIDQALKGFAKIEVAKEAIKDPVEIKVTANTRVAERQISSFEKTFKRTADKAAQHLSGAMHKEAVRIREDLVALGNLRIGIDISANQARRELAELQAELSILSHEDPNIDVKVDTGRAYAELATLEAVLKKIDGQDVDIHVDTHGAERAVGALSASGSDAANTFRSFNVILLAATSIGPALIPVLGAIAGGLLALGPAAAVAAFGLGSVLVGFSGIGGAMQALQAQQDQAVKTGQTAAKTEESSARRVADARRSAARAVESALDRQKAAQERYRDSINDVKDAEQALQEARDAAKNDGADIARRQKENQLGIDQALLDEFHTKVAFNSTMADGASTNADKEQARIDMEQAKLRMEELRQEQKDLAAEKQKWDTQGVNGTKEVETAQSALDTALERQKKAYKDLGEAARDVDRARADGARQVKEALQQQAEALAAVNTQQANVDAAMSKLGPAGQKFTRFLFGIRDDFYAFRDDVQSVLLPAVQSAMEGFFSSKNGKVARDALIALAGSFGKVVEALSKSFQGPAWGAFFQMLADLGPKIQEAYGGAFIKFMEAMASIMTTLAPFALDFARGLERMMTAFANWAASKEGQQALTDFMSWVQKVGPDVLDFIGAFAGAATNIVKALAPWGDIVLKALTGFLDFLAGLDPTTLGAILTALLVVIAASQVAYGIMSLVMALGALSALTIGPWIVAIIILAAAFAGLYEKNKKFRDFVKKAWKEISGAFKDAWEKQIQPAVSGLMSALKDLWNEVLAPLFSWLGPILIWVAVHIIPLVALHFSLMVRALTIGVRVIIWVVNAIVTSVKWMWNRVLKQIWKDMGGTWHDLMSGMKWVWNHVLKPVWDFITDKALPKLQSAFSTAVDAIKTIWDGLKKVVGAPIKFVLDTIINNGLIDGFNKVAGWVGMKGFDHIPIPKALQSYATGGVMPGYTPGKDVHSFYSPTAGRLELSGGEAVMRPEWTAAMGPSYVNAMNALARKGGVRAVRQAMDGMGGYWMGGILPLSGGKFARHTSGYNDFAGDLNYGSGYDDYGMPVKAWKPGVVAQMNYIGDQSYGRWMVLNHAAGQASLYAHLSRFDAKRYIGEKVSGGQTLGYVGDLGNTGTPPTSHLHFEIMGGNVDYADTSTPDAQSRSIPGWLMGIVKNPLGAVKGWITDPLKDAAKGLTESPVWDYATKVPLLAAKKMTDKVWDVVPGWVKTAAGWAGDAAGWAVGGVEALAGAAGDAASGVVGGVKSGAGHVADFLGLAEGGILPYNGTMKYDNGGYLPPGLTSVVNLTGKPEPVFTADQWGNMGGAGDGAAVHYEPHFHKSDLTARDVAFDLDVEFDRLGRKSKRYGG
jgi:hypothetical protein